MLWVWGGRSAPEEAVAVARQTGGAWAAVEHDGGGLARVPGANDAGAAGRATDPAQPVALFASERAAERFLLAVFGPEAGRAWGVGHLSAADAAAARIEHAFD
jgi:hypothetical protein